MYSFDWRFFTLAFLSVLGLIGIGVGIGEANALIITISTVLAILSVTGGFVLKRIDQGRA